jgi:signal transduction histidine kinase
MFEELSLHLLDIAMNSITANARTVEVSVLENQKRDWLILRVRDDGRGMDSTVLDKVLSGNWSTKVSRKKPVGLGLALLRQTTEMCGGNFRVRSTPGHGTSVTASMRLSHIDRPPVGDLQGTMLTLCAANPAVDVRLCYHGDEGKFVFSSQELNQKEG